MNLRAALDDLDPFVNASKPVARKLRPYLGELRPLARDAVPTVRNLRRTVRRPGGANDLRELQQTYPKLEEVALVERRRNGADRRGAFPELSEALRGQRADHRPRAARTPPTCSAGSTTSRTPARATRWAASRACRPT